MTALLNSTPKNTRLHTADFALSTMKIMLGWKGLILWVMSCH